MREIEACETAARNLQINITPINSSIKNTEILLSLL
jgi:hypothetical protein